MSLDGGLADEQGAAISALDRPRATSAARRVRARSVRRVPRVVLVRAGTVAEVLDEPPHQVWREQRVAFCDHVDGVDQLVSVASLRMNPAAPARIASYRYLSWSKVVRMRTREGPPSRTISRVAWMPSSTGIRMSMSRTSGSAFLRRRMAACRLRPRRRLRCRLRRRGSAGIPPGRVPGHQRARR